MHGVQPAELMLPRSHPPPTSPHNSPRRTSDYPYPQPHGQLLQQHRRQSSSASEGADGGEGVVPRGISTITADKSCTRCRERKVRCDRIAPMCTRCRKRKEECAYPEDTIFEDSEAPIPGAEEEARIAALEAKLATLEDRLAQSSLSSPSFSQSPSGSSELKTSVNLLPPPDSSFFDLGTAIFASLTSAFAEGRGTRGEEDQVLAGFLTERITGTMRIGVDSLDSRLSAGALGRELMGVLVEASFEACCSRLPCFKLLRKVMQPYDYRKRDMSLEELDPSAQVAVVVLCALGARCCPHSALLGTLIDPSTASPALLLSVGERRENACRKLVDLAWELAWKLRVTWSGEGGGTIRDEITILGWVTGPAQERWYQRERIERKAMEALVGMTQLLIFEEIRPKKSRWLLRTAIGMYQDLQLDHPETDVNLEELKRTIGPLIFHTDATISSQLLTPPLISTTQLDELFSHTEPITTFSHTPALEFIRLVDALVVNPHITSVDLELTFVAASGWVCACQRQFGLISCTQRPTVSTHMTLASIRTLWNTVDYVHGAVQRLQHALVNIPYIPLGLEGDIWAVDHFILLGVRLDTRLVDLCNLAHGYLGRSVVGGLGRDNEELEAMRRESDMRVRKCLKLSAFYSELYLSSRDKHVVYHLVMQLELLPDWTHIAAERVGDVPGPLSHEFELTNEELDWFVAALQVACFYSPLPAQRLKELAAARGLAPPALVLPNVSPSHSPSSRVGTPSPPSRFTPPVLPASTSPSPFASAASPTWSAIPTSNPSALAVHPSALALPNASKVTFNTYSVPVPAVPAPPVPVSQVPELANAFRGQSWLDLALTEPAASTDAWETPPAAWDVGMEHGGLSRPGTGLEYDEHGTGEPQFGDWYP